MPVREIYAETERPLSILAVLASPPVVYLVLCCAEGDTVSGSVQCVTTCFPPYTSVNVAGPSLYSHSTDTDNSCRGCSQGSDSTLMTH